MGQRIRIWDCFGPGQGLISQRNQKQFSTDWINWITGAKARTGQSPGQNKITQLMDWNLKEKKLKSVQIRN